MKVGEIWEGYYNAWIYGKVVITKIENGNHKDYPNEDLITYKQIPDTFTEIPISNTKIRFVFLKMFKKVY